MTVRVDEARKENRIAQIDGFMMLRVPQLRETSDRFDAFAANQDRAIVNRRRRNRENSTGAEEHQGSRTSKVEGRELLAFDPRPIRFLLPAGGACLAKPRCDCAL